MPKTGYLEPDPTLSKDLNKDTIFTKANFGNSSKERNESLTTKTSQEPDPEVENSKETGLKESPIIAIDGNISAERKENATGNGIHLVEGTLAPVRSTSQAPGSKAQQLPDSKAPEILSPKSIRPSQTSELSASGSSSGLSPLHVNETEIVMMRKIRKPNLLQIFANLSKISI